MRRSFLRVRRRVLNSSNEPSTPGTIMCPSAERDNRCVEGRLHDVLMSRELGGGLHRTAGSLLLLRQHPRHLGEQGLLAREGGLRVMAAEGRNELREETRRLLERQPAGAASPAAPLAWTDPGSASTRSGEVRSIRAMPGQDELPSITALTVLDAAVRRGSLAGAAMEPGMSPGATSRQVTAPEGLRGGV